MKKTKRQINKESRERYKRNLKNRSYVSTDKEIMDKLKDIKFI